jgi:hypothetical protein
MDGDAIGSSLDLDRREASECLLLSSPINLLVLRDVKHFTQRSELSLLRAFRTGAF